MKKFYFLTTLLFVAFLAISQEKLYVYQKDGSITEFYCSNVDSVSLMQEFVPYTPGENDGEDENENEDEDENDDTLKLFSINPVDKVLFSPGNLQYHPVKDEWRFALDQTEHIGNDNANISPNYYGWIDLFGWGTGYEPTKTSIAYEDYCTFVDWGVNKIGDDEPNTWRSLTIDEWVYLLNSRENASDLIAIGRVKGNNGVILLPDNWVCPEGVIFKTGFAADDYEYSAFQVITEPEWEVIEASGAIFLPATGYRKGVTIYELQESYRYWVGYWHMTTTAGMFYGTAKGAEITYTYPFDGLAVRLVSTQTF